MGLNPSHPVPSVPTGAGTRTLTRTWLAMLMVFPWVAPWSPAPQANTVPLLISWACMALLLLQAHRLQPLDIARAWAVAALLSSVMGLVQYFGLAPTWGGVLHVTALGEAYANLRQRNQLATLLGMGLLAVLWWQAHGLRTRHALWMLALLAVANAATTSRTGLLHMVLITALTVYWSYRSGGSGARRTAASNRLALWALAVYLLANGALPWCLNVLYGQDAIKAFTDALTRMGHNEGCGSRRVLWANVIELINLKPWAGWGWDELKYAHYITPYTGGPEQRFCDILGNAHNLPLHLAVTLGLPVAVVLGLAGLAFMIWARPWQSRWPSAQLAWSVLAVIGLHSLLEFPLWYGPFQMAVLLCAALLLAPHATLLSVVRPVQLAGVLILLGVCVVGADYARARQIYAPPNERWGVWRDDPLGAARSSWFFGRSASFAELSMTRITPDNAAWVLDTSLKMLHYSPEPKVVRSLILSAHLLGRQDLVDLHSERWRAAFPTAPLPVP